MLTPELRVRLGAVCDGEITECHEVRPILCDAMRILVEASRKVLEDHILLDRAKDAFAFGWEAEFTEADGADEL
jgi:hypothetical protein